MKRFIASLGVALFAVIALTAPASFDPVFAGTSSVHTQPSGDRPLTEAEERAVAGGCFACAGVMMLIPIIVIIASILIGLWMYRDAQRRGNPQAAMWLVIGIIFNIVGLMIYLVVRKNANAPPPPMA